jgi:DNA topoisomerase-2
VEPKYFIPVVPFLLINGAQGIGTGWSTKIPSYDIEDVLDIVEMKIRGIQVLSSIFSLLTLASFSFHPFAG